MMQEWLQDKNNEARMMNWLPVVVLGGMAAAGFYLWRRPGGKFSEADRRFRALLREEQNQKRPFPKDVDLEPAFE